MLLAGCASRGPTVRKYAERSYAGRNVSAEAYAQHLESQLLAADGQKAAAQASLERASRQDPASAHLAAVAGELRCKANAAGAAKALRQLTRLRPESVRAWLALSRCLSRQGRVGQALSAARRAVASDPYSAEATQLVVQLHETRGDSEAARRWALALFVAAPGDRRAQELWLSFGTTARRSPASGERDDCFSAWRGGDPAKSARACAKALGVRPSAWNARAMHWLSGGKLMREPMRQPPSEPLLPEVQDAIRQRVQDTVGPRAAATARTALKVSDLHELAVQPERSQAPRRR